MLVLLLVRFDLLLKCTKLSVLYSPCDIDHDQFSDYQGPREFYHIESTDDAKLRSFNTRTPGSIVHSVPRKNYRVYNISNERSNSFTDQSLLSSDTGSKRNLWFDDEYTTKSFKSKSGLKSQSNHFPVKNHPERKKPNRVTIFSLPPRTSPSSLTNLSMTFDSHHVQHISYYEDDNNGIPIKHIRLA
jgi:hypothetical protein